ncbi:hypothetical protein ACFYV5_06235 [Streptomyces sp. NPDC003035]|uniref:hypothetical protein n=1 Tax=Streptomyces sp. NPDC003035 TaxID=3364676 RepID=UPI0036C1A563
MAITVPAAEDVQALCEFIMQRAEEEHAATIGDEALDPDAMARFWRISNSDGAFFRALTVAGTLQSRVAATERGDYVTGDAVNDWVRGRAPPAQPAPAGRREHVGS